MLFSYQHIHLIKLGIKTQTRRAWKRQCVKVGNLYPIMRNYREKHNRKDGFILIKEVYKQELGVMPRQDAYDEGRYTPQSYIKIWKKINHSYNPNQIVYVIKFRYVSTNKRCNYVTDKKGKTTHK